MQTFWGLGGGFYKYISMEWISLCYRDPTERFPLVKELGGEMRCESSVKAK